jgi:hypothetical protein
MDAKLGIDDGRRVGPHLAGPDRVVGGFCRLLHPVEDFVIGGQIGAGHDFAHLNGAMAGAVMIARAMRTARTVSSASGGDDRKLKLIAGGRRGSAR